jgi:hypothetical protein
MGQPLNKTVCSNKVIDVFRIHIGANFAHKTRKNITQKQVPRNLGILEMITIFMIMLTVLITQLRRMKTSRLLIPERKKIYRSKSFQMEY